MLQQAHGISRGRRARNVVHEVRSDASSNFKCLLQFSAWPRAQYRSSYTRRGSGAFSEVTTKRGFSPNAITSADGVLETGDGRTGGERPIGGVGSEGPASDAQPEHRIMSQRMAVVAIFVAASDLVEALPQDVVQGVGNI